MGCTTSEPVKKKEPGEHVNYLNVADENPEYALPYVPELTKSEIWDLEVNQDIQDRIDNIPPGTDNSYKTLLQYLSDGTTKEIHHVTAIYFWMKSQDYESESLDQDDLDLPSQKGQKRRSAGRDKKVDPTSGGDPPDTPRGYMKMIKDGKGDFTSFFTILCRRSGIACNILRGLGKDEKFHIGMSEQLMTTQWTAAYVDQEWKLSHIQWAMENRRDGNQNVTRNNVSDFYFLMDPEDFAHFCHPDDFNWQLIDRPYSKKEFLAMPNFRPQSFFLDMAIITPKNGTTKTAKSSTEIEIAFPKKIMDETEVSFVYKYHQELITKQSSEHMERRLSLPKKLDNFVFVNRRPTKFIFEIQLPAAGKYLFDIYAKCFKKDTHGQQGTDTSLKTTVAFERLVQFRLISELDPDEGDIDPLPDSPDNGWGPGPTCRQLGLVPLTHFDSYIFIKPGEFRDIRFRMKSKLEVQCQLTHNFLPIYQLVEQIEQEIMKDEVHIRVQIPEEGTYALKIYCRPKGTKEFNETCVYLLKQQVQSRLPEKYRDKMLRSRLEYHIENHTTEKDLKEAMDVYNCYNVPDHGEMKLGQEKLKQYWEVKREIHLARRGRNITNLRKWIQKAKRSKYRADLQEEIQKAESLEDSMSKRNGYAHPIAKMDEHTITEIHNYKHPPQVVHDVMRSTYLLLGEDTEYLDIWEHIQFLMGRTGKNGLKKTIMNRQVEDVSLEQADEAETIILPYNLNKCRAVSTGIGSFYKWCNRIIQGVNQRDMSEREKLAAQRELLHRLTFRDDYDEGLHTNSPISPTNANDETIQNRGRETCFNFTLSDTKTDFDTDLHQIEEESEDSENGFQNSSKKVNLTEANNFPDDVKSSKCNENIKNSKHFRHINEYALDRKGGDDSLDDIYAEVDGTEYKRNSDISEQKQCTGAVNSLDNQGDEVNTKHISKQRTNMLYETERSVSPKDETNAKHQWGQKNTGENAMVSDGNNDRILKSDKPCKQFLMIPVQPKKGDDSKPVSYAGFKVNSGYSQRFSDNDSTELSIANSTYKRFADVPSLPKDNGLKPISYAGFKRYNTQSGTP